MNSQVPKTMNIFILLLVVLPAFIVAFPQHQVGTETDVWKTILARLQAQRKLSQSMLPLSYGVPNGPDSSSLWQELAREQRESELQEADDSLPDLPASLPQSSSLSRSQTARLLRSLLAGSSVRDSLYPNQRQADFSQGRLPAEYETVKRGRFIGAVGGPGGANLGGR